MLKIFMENIKERKLNLYVFAHKHLYAKNMKYYDCFKVILAILENVRIHRCSYLHSFTMYPDTNRKILYIKTLFSQ